MKKVPAHLPPLALVLAVLVITACGSSSDTATTSTGDGGVPDAGGALRDGSLGDALGAGDALGDASADAIRITTTSLPVADLKQAYSTILRAVGGHQPYSWSLGSGTLPAGLSLSAAGTIAGTPTAAGTSTFTVKVADASTPQLTATAALSIAVSTIWYVRPDGGTRYSAARVAANMSAQCNGLADAPYPGSGVNQPCAFNDYRFLFDDQTYGNTNQGKWVINGGDTVVIRGGPWRVGFDSASDTKWCFGGQGPYSCMNPTIPAGTASQHTRILGENYASCSNGNATTRSALTQIFGGFGVNPALNLAGAKYVDVECLEVTEHNGQCIVHGSPAYPRACNTGSPTLDDYDGNGVGTDATTSNVSLQDVYVHGHTASGIAGPIGGPINLTRVGVSFNGFAGWNFDDGNDTPDAPGSSIDASYVTMIGNGCNEEYPITHAFPAMSCYDLNSGGFGDSWSGQDTKLDSFTCDHCVQAHNTKDGFIGPHTQMTKLTITNSASYGNMGQQWKWGATPNSTTVFENSVTVGNCMRMSAPMPGAPSNYNQYLSLFCRAAGDMFSFYSAANSTVLFANDATVGYSATMFDLNCQMPGACGSTSYVFRNNIMVGLLNPAYNPSNPQTPGLYYLSDTSDVVTADHDIYYDMRNGCPSTGNMCGADPKFANEPAEMMTSESQLDNFNFDLSPGSPAIGAGVPIPALTTDYAGNPYTNPPNIGAY